MKKILSAAIAIVLAVFSVIPAFAQGSDEPITDEEYTEFMRFVDACHYTFVDPEPIINKTYPYWTEDSKQRMAVAVEEVRARTITTASQLEQAYADMFEVSSTMYVEKGELKYMYYLFINENNDNGYYSDELWNEVQQLITDAKTAYYSGDEQLVHHVYIKMRNTYDALCKYNTVYGDFSGDGELNVVDVTYLQKYIVELTEFNSSQKMLSYINGEDVSGASIKTATYMQKYIVGLVTQFGNGLLDKLVAAQPLVEGDNIRIVKAVDSNLIRYESVLMSENENNCLYSNTYMWYFSPQYQIYNTFEV